jgi:hypothetical protein
MDYGCKQRRASDQEAEIAQESVSDQDAVITQEGAYDHNCGHTQDQEHARKSICGTVLLLEKKTSLDGVTTALALFSDRVEETP